ncbi:putative C-type lectin-like domain family 1 isoform X3 [Ursus arctos]|uniref:putative C-type lectin-like domain family 1 isoform X3 n=1 Tax=Ursus arctos TaxID=9644 RepID=UPI002018186D|nr:putative C-type lectin-like domain family 1 isoform X3 [Ursus arctos]
MNSNFLPYHEVFEYLLACLVRLNTLLLSYSHRGNSPNLGKQKNIAHLDLFDLPEVYLQNYETPYRITSFFVFSLFLIRAMAGDIVYADVKIDRTFSSENSSSLQKSDPHHHGIFLKVGCAMIVILCVTVIVLSVLVIQFKSARLNTVENESKEKFCTGKNKSGAITSTVSFNFSSAHKSCPSKDWKLHGGKCYWVAEDKKSWDESKNDCVMKNSHLMVIQDIIDMSFLWRYLNTSVFYWIGLRIPPGKESWAWVDNNPFDPHLFSIEEKPITRSVKCAQVSPSKVVRKKCEQNDHWICQL